MRDTHRRDCSPFTSVPHSQMLRPCTLWLYRPNKHLRDVQSQVIFQPQQDAWPNSYLILKPFFKCGTRIPFIFLINYPVLTVSSRTTEFLKALFLDRILFEIIRVPTWLLRTYHLIYIFCLKVKSPYLTVRKAGTSKVKKYIFIVLFHSVATLKFDVNQWLIVNYW